MTTRSELVTAERRHGGASLKDKQVLREAFGILAGPSDLAAALRRLAERVQEHLEVDWAGIWLNQDDSLGLHLIAQAEGPQAATEPLRPDAWQGFLSWMTAHGSDSLVLDNLQADPQSDIQGTMASAVPDLGWAKEQGWVSFVGAPLRLRHQAVGVLTLVTRQPRSFAPKEVDLVELLAAAAATAVANAGDRRSTAKTESATGEPGAVFEEDFSDSESGALEEITRVVQSAQDVQEILKEVCRRAALLCEAGRGSILLWDEEASRISPAMSQLASGEPQKPLPPGSVRLPTSLRDMPTTRRIIETRQPLVVDEQSSQSGAVLRAFGVKSALAMPLIALGKVMGMLILDNTVDKPDPFDSHRVALGMAVANQAAVALHKALLHQETADRLRQTESLLAIARTVSSTLELGPLVQAIARQAARACEMDRCSINLWQDDRFVPMRSRLTGDGDVQELWQELKWAEGMALEEIPFAAEMMRTHQPVLMDESSQAGDWAPWRKLGLKAMLVVPLVRQEEVFGCMVYHNTDNEAAVRSRQVDLATAIASQVGLALDNARLHAETEERLRQTQAHLVIASSLGSTLELVPLLETVVQQAARACRMERCGVLLWDEKTDQVVPLMSQFAHPEEDLQQWDPFTGLEGLPLEDMPLLAEALEKKEPIILDDPARDPRTTGWIKLFEPESFLMVPLICKERPLGALVFDNVKPAAPVTREQVDLATTIAGQVALALDNARLHEETEKRLRQTEEMLEIARVLSSTLELKPLLKEVTQRVARVCDMERSSISLLDGEWVVPMMSQFGDGRVDPEAWQTYKAIGRTRVEELPYFAEMMRTLQPVIINDPGASPLWPRSKSVYDNTAVIIVPLIRQGKVVGALLMGNSERPGPLRNEQVDLATTLATQVALVVDNARHYRATQQQLRQTEEQLNIARTLGSTLDIKLVLKEITRQAARACEFERCSIYLWGEDRRVVPMMSQFADGRSSVKLWEAFKRLDESKVEELPFFAEAVRRRAPVIVNDAATDPLWPDSVAQFETKVALVVPLIREGEVVGAMDLDNHESTTPVTPRQVDLATTIASQVALALENARFYEETRKRLRQTEAHLELARTVTSTVEPRRLLKEITRQAAQACGMDRCSLYRIEGERVVPLMSQYADGREDRRLWGEFKKLGHRRLEEMGFLTEAVERREPVVIENPASLLRVDRQPKTMLVIPFVRQGDVEGAMVLVNTDRAAPLRPGQVAVATTIANQLAVASTIASQVALALDNSRLYEETERRLQVTEILLGLAQTVGAVLDRGTIAQLVARELSQLLGADTSIFFEMDEEANSGRSVAGHGVPEALRRIEPQAAFLEEAPFMVEAKRTGRPMATSDFPNDPRFKIPETVQLPIQPRSLVFVPVLSQRRRIGALISFWWNDRHEFTDEELRLATGIADQMALGLENARHYEQAQEALADLKATQDRLVRSERLRTLAEMAGAVAHDFRNLLTAILGRAEILNTQLQNGGTTPEEIRIHLDVIELAAKDGAKTVQRLLDYTRAESHPEEFEEVDVNQLLVQAREVSKPRWQNEAESQGIRIEVSLELGEVPPVTANPAQLREVLLNLVYNAIDALPSGGAVVLASGAEEGHVWLKVEDTGIGMSEDLSQRIFDPFFTTKGRGSSGLGLSSSYGIIQGHGGDIAVSSQPGRGTRFTLKLPR